jgi:hypothetical protein
MEETKTIFSSESLDRANSPEKIDEIIRVSTVGTWIPVLAMLIILAGVLIWGFTGSIAKTASAAGVVWDERGGDVICLLPPDVSGQYLVGHEARITLPDGSAFSSKVVKVSQDPVSYEELGEMTRSDWRLQTLWGDYDNQHQYAVRIGVDEAHRLADRTLVNVSVVLNDVKPIEYVFN